MDVLNADELWRKIPPEEKLNLMSRSHSDGIVCSFFFILIAATFAISYQKIELFWGSFVFCPIIFQFFSNRRWKQVRPEAMIRYLAARSAARRFAYGLKANDLTLKLIFRGKVEKIYDEKNVLEQIEATRSAGKVVDVWVALFNDCLVCISERHGGAQLQFGALLNDKFSFSELEDSQTLSANSKMLELEFIDKRLGTKRAKLSSSFPAAMSVLEQSLQKTLKGPDVEVELDIPTQD
jgi:hypothetical protein